MHYLQTVVTTLQAVMRYAHISARCIPLCHKNCARVARPSFRVLVMQYIQRYGGSGLVHETSVVVLLRQLTVNWWVWPYFRHEAG